MVSKIEGRGRDMKYDVHYLETTFKRIVDESPEYVYRQPGPDACVYAYEGKPSCVVGHWLAAEGIPLPDWGSALNSLESDSSEFLKFLGSHGVELDYDGVWFMSRMQEMQDRGIPWGRAYQKAMDSR